MNKWRDYFGSQEEWDTHAKQFENNDFRQLYDWGEYLKSTGVNIERLAVSSNDKIHISVQYTIRKIWPFCLIYLPSGINGSANEFVPSTFTQVETVSWDAQSADLKLNLSGNVSIPISQVYRIGDDSLDTILKDQTDQAGDK